MKITNYGWSTSGLRISPGPRPQNANHYDKPGSYQLALRIRDTEINPGDTTELEVYVTGYGVIEGAKILFHPPPHFVDENWCTASYNISLSSSGEFSFGAKEQSIAETGGMLILDGGAQYRGWPSPSNFFDITDNPGQAADVHTIVSEEKLTKALLEYSIKTKRNTLAGTHQLNLYLTYFNGQEWKSDSKSVQLKVTNWFERNQLLSLAIAALSLLVAVGPTLVSRLRWLLDAIS